jgi:RHS repeat-associated protein
MIVWATGAYDTDNKLLSAGATIYSYDNRGNLKTKTGPGGFTSYQYNYGNKLTNVGLPMGGSVGMQYSAAGNRLSKKASPTVYFNITCSYCEGCCQWYCDVTMEFDDDGTEVASYTSGPQIDEHISVTMSGTTYYYVTDGLGSVTAIYDQYENYVTSYEYGPFGNFHQYGALANPYTFTGRAYDNETGLYYNNERYYDPEVGRFTSQDPLDADSPNPSDEERPQHHSPAIQEGSSDNLYAYVGNNPINRVDPLGLYWQAVRGLTLAERASPCASGKGGCGGTLYSPRGTAKCDLNRSPCQEWDKKNNNEGCTAPCTKEHEDQHEKDMKDCCDKARSAHKYENARKKVLDEEEKRIRGRGLGDKTLKKKLAELDKIRNGQKWDRKIAAAINRERAQVRKDWSDYGNKARNWTECNAFGASIACADRLWDEYNCDCPKPEDEECCEEIEQYKKSSERQKRKRCKAAEKDQGGKKGGKKGGKGGKGGGKGGGGPECPFNGKK